MTFGPPPLLTFVLSSLTALFVVVDPIACVPLFVTITEGDSLAQKQRAAFRASLVAGVVLAIFALAGTFLFGVLGVSESAFRIAGGALLFLLAVDMLRAQPSRQRTTPEEEQEGASKPDVSVFPLGVPMLAGPGATSTVMVLIAKAHHMVHYAVVLASIVITMTVTYWILRWASVITRRLGRTGMNVLERVMGLIVSAVAVQFVIDGFRLLMS
jgi:multiple antibiotic resistance protein